MRFRDFRSAVFRVGIILLLMISTEVVCLPSLEGSTALSEETGKCVTPDSGFPRLDLIREQFTDSRTDYSRVDLHYAEAELQRLKDRIEKKYAISIRLDGSEYLEKRFGIEVVPYSKTEQKRHLASLNTWLRKYPESYIKNSGLEAIYLLKSWKYDDTETGGFSLGHGIMGIIAHENFFHHELFHIADETDGGLLSENWDWQRHKYGQLPQGLSIKGEHLPFAIENSIKDTSRPDGFISSYGKYGGIDEDQATLAAAMLTNYRKVLSVSELDSVVEKSSDYIRQFFYSRSNGQMDTAFWNTLKDGSELSDDYWSQREQSHDFVIQHEFENERKDYLDIVEARKLLRAGDVKQAEKIYHKVITRNPKNTNLVRELTTYYEKNKMYRKAIYLYKLKSLTQPDHHFDLDIAHNYRRLGMLDQAVAHYKSGFARGYYTDVDTKTFNKTYSGFIETLKSAGHTKQFEKEKKLMERLFNRDLFLYFYFNVTASSLRHIF